MSETHEHEVNEEEVPESDNPEGENEFSDSFFQDPLGLLKLDKDHRIWKFIKDRFEQLNSSLLHLIEEQKKQADNFERYLQIVSNCQKQTAAVANSQFEKTLHPAIETVDTLTTLICRIHEQTTDLSDAQVQCPLFKTILSSIAQAAQVAKAKREYLDMEKVEPKELDQLNPERHDIRQAVPTIDSSKHKKIKETLVPGLIYRGTVLRQAKVSVYRYSENDGCKVNL